MGILSGFIKTKRYRKTDQGYILQSELTMSDTVNFSDGTTLTDKINELDNKVGKDSNGNDIVNTYVTKIALGTQVTYSLEGTTLTITTKEVT